MYSHDHFTEINYIGGTDCKPFSGRVPHMNYNLERQVAYQMVECEADHATIDFRAQQWGVTLQSERTVHRQGDTWILQ